MTSGFSAGDISARVSGGGLRCAGFWAIVLCAAFWLTGCASGEPAEAPDAPSSPALVSIVGCGLPALTGPLTKSPNAMQHAAQVYEALETIDDILGALVGVSANRCPRSLTRNSMRQYSS